MVCLFVCIWLLVYVCVYIYIYMHMYSGWDNKLPPSWAWAGDLVGSNGRCVFHIAAPTYQGRQGHPATVHGGGQRDRLGSNGRVVHGMPARAPPRGRARVHVLSL